MAFKVFELWYDETLPVDQRTIRVRADVLGVDRIRFPKWEIIHYDVPARGALPAYTVSWYNGLAAPNFRETIERPLGRRLITGGPGSWKEHAGCLVIGSKGTIHSTEHNSSYKLLPKEEFASYEKPEPTLPRHGSHEREWVRACRGGPQAMSNFDYGAVLTEFVLLGNVATQFDRPINYHPVKMQCVGDEEADAALRRAHRPGWEIS